MIAWCGQAAGQQDPEGEELLEISEFGGLEGAFLFSREGEVESATKHLLSIRNAPATINVLTAEEIRRSGLRNVGLMLRRFPGTFVGIADTSSVEFASRGQFTAGTADVLTLVDGVSYFDDLYGANRVYAMPFVPSEIERLEWVRGAGASIYGANAFKGALSIYTRSPTKLGTVITTGVGERDTFYTDVVSAHQIGENSFLKIVAGVESADSYRGPTGGSRQEDVLDRQLGKVTFHQVMSEQGFYELELAFINADNNTIRNFAKIPIEEEYSIFRGLFEDGPLRVTLGAQTSSVDGKLVNRFDFQKTVVDLDGTYKFIDDDEDLLLVGANFRFIDVNSNDFLSNRNRRRFTSLYSQFDHSLSERMSAAVGFRAEMGGVEPDKFVLLPRAAFLYDLDQNGNHGLRISYGRSHRNPTLINEALNTQVATGLPSPPVFQVVPNRDVRPSIRDSLEIAYRGSMTEKLDIGLTAFHDWQKSPISSRLIAGVPPNIQSINIDRTRVQGLESELRWLFDERASGYLSYTYTAAHGSFASQGTTPRHMATAGVTIEPWDHVSIGLDGAWHSRLEHHNFLGRDRFETDIFTVSGRLAVRPKWIPGEFGLNAQNLFNRRHQETQEGVIVGSTVSVDYRVEF